MGDIKTRFAIEGEQQFRSAMTNAANAVKVLNSEQKLAKAQFQNTGNAEKYAADQARILKEKIEQQKTAVKAAEQALKQLADNGVASNTRQFQQWQKKLNNAQTELVNMQTQLQNVTGTMNETTSAAGETGEAISAIGQKVSFDAVIGGIGKITGTLESAATKAKELALDLVNAMKDSASWADELATTATVYGYSTEDIQRMRYTADILDTSLETIIKSRQKLANAMQSGNDAFGVLGVTIREWRDLGGSGPELAMRNWADVFWDVGEALTRIENEKGFEYVNKQAQQLFGKSWEQLKPIFNSDWASADNYLGKAFSSAREYYEAVKASWNVVSDEDISKLTKYDDAIQRMENNFETLKQTITAQPAPGFTDLTNMVSGLLEEFNKYLATEEGQEKLNDLSEAVTELFSSLTDVDFGKALELAKGAIDGLTDGLKWIKNNWKTVENGLKALGIAFGLLKVSETVLTFFQLLASGKFLFGGGAAAAGAGAGAGAGAAGAAGAGGAAAGAGGVKGILSAGVKVLPYALPVALGVDSLVHQQELIDIALKRGAESVQEYKEKSAKYRSSDMFGIWDTLMKYTTVNGDAEDSAAMEDFARHYMQWFSDEISDATLDKMTEAMSDENYDLFHDVMRRISDGEFFYSDEDINTLLTAMQAAKEATEKVMENDPALIPTSFTVPEDAADQIAKTVGGITLPVSFGIAGTSIPWTGKIALPLFGHANGIWSVPWDGYPAILHKGERVTPAREVAASRNYSSNLYVESMYMNNGTDAAGLAAAMAAAQRRVMSGFGS